MSELPYLFVYGTLRTAGGIGRLVKIAVEEGRATRPNLKIGVCGEHGGDPDSVHFFHGAGLDYVSCSPFRVPVARLEAGRAAVLEASGGGSDSRGQRRQAEAGADKPQATAGARQRVPSVTVGYDSHATAR